MRHPILDQHQIISWDADGTLVGDQQTAPNAVRFLRYIFAHPEKTHYIVTFRDPSWALMVYAEIVHIVPRERIAGVHSCPQQFERAYHDKRLDDAHSDVVAYTHWKAKVSTEIGATLLVDDMTHIVQPGCTRYGVALLDAHAAWADDGQATDGGIPLF